MDEHDLSRLQQVVGARSRIQDVALELLQLMHAHRDVRTLGEAGDNPYDLLVGAVFSLWRAVFLADGVTDWNGALADAESFLEKVVRDNTIGYLDDWRSRKWSFSYYLKNARYRLNEFSELHPEFRALLEKHRSYRAIDEPVIGSHPFDVWWAHCNAVWDAIEVIRKSTEERRI